MGSRRRVHCSWCGQTWSIHGKRGNNNTQTRQKCRLQQKRCSILKEMRGECSICEDNHRLSTRPFPASPCLAYRCCPPSTGETRRCYRQVAVAPDAGQRVRQPPAGTRSPGRISGRNNPKEKRANLVSHIRRYSFALEHLGR